MNLIEGIHYHWEGDRMVFTSRFHLERGHCCGSRCRHCPYEPRWTEGSTRVAAENDDEDTARGD